jgi:hypothetical protein
MREPEPPNPREGASEKERDEAGMAYLDWCYRNKKGPFKR